MDFLDSWCIMLEPDDPPREGPMKRMKTHQFLEYLSDIEYVSQAEKATKSTEIEQTDLIGCGWITTCGTQTEIYQTSAGTDPIVWPMNNSHTQTKRKVKDVGCNARALCGDYSTDTAELLKFADANCGTRTLEVTDSSTNTMTPVKRSGIVLPVQRKPVPVANPASSSKAMLFPNASTNVPNKPVAPRGIKISLEMYKDKRRHSSEHEKCEISTQTEERLALREFKDEMEHMYTHLKRLKNLIRTIYDHHPTKLNRFAGQYLDHVVQLTKKLTAEVPLLVIAQDKLKTKSEFEKSPFWELTTNPYGKLPTGALDKTENETKAPKRLSTAAKESKSDVICIDSSDDDDDRRSSAKRRRLEVEKTKVKHVKSTASVAKQPRTPPYAYQEDAPRRRAKSQSKTIRKSSSPSLRSLHRRCKTPSATPRNRSRSPTKSSSRSTKRTLSRSRSPRSRHESLDRSSRRTSSLERVEKRRERSSSASSRNSKAHNDSKYTGRNSPQIGSKNASRSLPQDSTKGPKPKEHPKVASPTASPESRDPRLRRKVSDQGQAAINTDTAPKRRGPKNGSRSSDRSQSSFRKQSSPKNDPCSKDTDARELGFNSTPHQKPRTEAELAYYRHLNTINHHKQNDKNSEAAKCHQESKGQSSPPNASDENVRSKVAATLHTLESWLKNIRRSSAETEEGSPRFRAASADQSKTNSPVKIRPHHYSAPDSNQEAQSKKVLISPLVARCKSTGSSEVVKQPLGAVTKPQPVKQTPIVLDTEKPYSKQSVVEKVPQKPDSSGLQGITIEPPKPIENQVPKPVPPPAKLYSKPAQPQAIMPEKQGQIEPRTQATSPPKMDPKPAEIEPRKQAISPENMHPKVAQPPGIKSENRAVIQARKQATAPANKHLNVAQPPAIKSENQAVLEARKEAISPAKMHPKDTQPQKIQTEKQVAIEPQKQASSPAKMQPKAAQPRTIQTQKQAEIEPQNQAASPANVYPRASSLKDTTPITHSENPPRKVQSKKPDTLSEESTTSTKAPKTPSENNPKPSKTPNSAPQYSSSTQISPVSGPRGSRLPVKHRLGGQKKRKSNHYGQYSRISTHVTQRNDYGRYNEFPFTHPGGQEMINCRSTQNYYPPRLQNFSDSGRAAYHAYMAQQQYYQDSWYGQ